MQLTKNNQEKVLNLMSRTMSKVEEENFAIKKIHLYSPYYSLLGNDWYKGTVLILASDKYMNKIIKSSFKNNYEEKNDASVFVFDGNFDWFKYDNYDEYKSIIFKVSENKDYYEFKNLIGKSYSKFPYLDKATKFMDKVKSDEELEELITDEFIESTIKTIKENLDSETKNTKVLAQKLIKRLNVRS